MHKIKQAGIIMSLLCISLGSMPAYADDDGDSYMESWGTRSRPGVKAVTMPLYIEECGSCHMAYQPGLLPAQSWEKIMLGLERHFGDNAELDSKSQRILLNYLLNNAAGRSDYRTSNRMMRNIKQPPMRITQLPYFIHKHREIAAHLSRDKPEISFSRCETCHTRAKQGSYNEDEIVIPGYGRYED